MAERGRFSVEIEEVAIALASIIEFRKRKDAPPKKPKAKDLILLPALVHNALTPEIAQMFAEAAIQHIVQWLTDDETTKRQRALPAKLRELADVLEARPLLPDPLQNSTIMPRAADPKAYAVLSLCYDAMRPLGNGSFSFDEIRSAIGRMPKKDRDTWFKLLGLSIDDRTARKNIATILGTGGKRGRPKKTG